MDRGSFVEFDGRPAVRFERTYSHPPERVWPAITEPGELAHWFPAKVSLEPRVGGTIEFTDDPNVPPRSGAILAFDPPRLLAYTWGGDELHVSGAGTDGPHSATAEPWEPHYDDYVATGMPAGAPIPGVRTES